MRTPLVLTAALVALLPLGLQAAGSATPRIRAGAVPLAPTAAAGLPGRGGDDPRAIIVQGGISPNGGCGGGTPMDAENAVAIGPKQDDPSPPPSTSRGAATGMASGRGAIAIGPKQDDPATPPPRSGSLASAMPNGRGPVALGPKQDDPGPPPSPESRLRCQPASH